MRHLSCVTYRLRPEPGPVGVKVDPLGEPLGASVFPDGFMVELGPLLAPPARPVVAPGGFPIELPFMDDPVVVPVVAEPPVVEPPPAVPPLLCASANVLENASAAANAVVMSFMVVSLVDDPRGNQDRRRMFLCRQHEDVIRARGRHPRKKPMARIRPTQDEGRVVLSQRRWRGP
jgi:hypothetical protein